MNPLRRLRVGDLDLAHRDVFDRDIEYIHSEIFLGNIYDHPSIRPGDGATIIDVGGNVGIFSIWAARKYRPKTILAYEASPTTFECLTDNLARHIDKAATDARCYNLAVSDAAGKQLVLNQPPWNSGLSTILDDDKLAWVGDLKGKGELITHKIGSTTVSAEIEKHGLATVDLLKIDVEGHFIEVLNGIAPADFARIRNIVLEAEYADELGHSHESLRALLQSKGYRAESRDDAQILIYAWRD